MKFLLIADNPSEWNYFFKTKEIWLFLIISCLILLILIPKNLLTKTLVNDSSPARLNYLQAFQALYPQDRVLTFEIIQQEIDLGLIEKAEQQLAILRKKGFAQDLFWEDYLILRYKAFHAKLNTKERILYLTQLRQMAQSMAEQPLSKKQLMSLAQDEVIIGKASEGLKIFMHLLRLNALTTQEEFIKGAKIAIQNNAHEEAALFYKKAYSVAMSQREKKSHALDAIKVLWAGNKVYTAVDFAAQIPNALLNDVESLLYLSRLAMAANRPDLAEKYAIRALILYAQKHHD